VTEVRKWTTPLHVCVSSSFRTLASILRCTLVSVTFYRYDFNKFEESLPNRYSAL